MNEEKKAMLLALIDGLAKRKSVSQFDDGEKVIDEKGIGILKDTIRSL